jgi:hypothetical protein
MAKLLSGSTINYGSVLPSTSKVADGALFYLTADYTDAAGSPSNSTATSIARTAGLYSFRFIQDLSPSIIGEQVGSGWVQISKVGDYVAKTGDSMSGDLNFTSTNGITFGVTNTDSASIRLRVNSADKTDLVFTIGDNGGYNDYFVWAADGSGGSGAPASDYMRLGVSSTGTPKLELYTYSDSTWNTVWHAGNDGSGSLLDADMLDGNHGSYYLNLTNASGTLDVSRGGTGATTAVQGGVAYGATVAQFGFTAAGTAGQVLLSNGTSAPVWANQSTLSVGTAATANAVAWANISEFASGAASANALKSISNYPISGQSVVIRPSYWYNYGNTGDAMTAPTSIPTSSQYGWEAYTTSDGGSYQVGLGGRGAGVIGYQLAFNWNQEEAAPVGAMRYRVNDDSSSTSAWGAWQTVWDKGNLTKLSQLSNDSGFVTSSVGDGRYVLKTGDTMTGPLVVGTGAGDNLTVNGLTVTWSNSSLSTTGTLTASSVTATASGNGYATLMQGGAASYSGYVAFFSSTNVRQGYIGHSPTLNTTDTGSLQYMAGNHLFTGNIIGGNLTLSGSASVVSLSATGDVIAYASDARLKTNVSPIENAIEKVKSLGGYEYDWNTEICEAVGFKPRVPHEHGLLAQEVLKVMPDAVAPAPFNAEYLTVKYEKIVSLLVKAVSDQQEMIDQLKAEVAALKGE